MSPDNLGKNQPGQGGTSLASVGIRDRNRCALFVYCFPRLKNIPDRVCQNKHLWDLDPITFVWGQSMPQSPSIPRNDDGVRVFNLNLRPVTPGCLWLDVPTESVQPMIKWPDNADGSDNHPWQNIIDCTPLSLYRVNLSVSNANIPKDQRTKSHSHTPWSPLRRLFPWSSQKRHSSILILAGCLYNLS